MHMLTAFGLVHFIPYQHRFYRVKAQILRLAVR
jgi:hypothetical protein